MTRTIFTYAVTFMLLTGCGPSTNTDPPVQTFDANDAAMNAAIQRARDNVDRFIEALDSPQSGQEDFAVKMNFTDGDVTEHMWLAPVRHDGGVFHGVVNNQPKSLTNVKLGQEVSVPRAEISDWMYLQDGKIVGAESLRVIRDTLSPKERAEFDQTMIFAE